MRSFLLLVLFFSLSFSSPLLSDNLSDLNNLNDPGASNAPSDPADSPKPHLGYIPQIIHQLPEDPNLLLSSPGGMAFLEARQKLLSASKEDLEEGYAAQLDKVVILGYQASAQQPNNPAVWRLLGHLAETRALFIHDPQARAALMADALSHFEHAARLEVEIQNELTDPVSSNAPITYTDPYLNELAWNKRLSRGEVDLIELERHYIGENINPLHNPDYWRDRFYLINSEDVTRRAGHLKAAREDFTALWAAMPVEVPWPGPQGKFGPLKFKKVEVLEAWAATLMALSETENKIESKRELFSEALALYPEALALPLDRFELAALIGQLDRADANAPDNDSFLALCELKDKVYQIWLTKAPDDPDVLLNWGQDFYKRADRQVDGRIFRSLIQEGDRKMAQYVVMSPQKAPAWHEWGQRLEYQTNTLASSLTFEAPGELTARQLFCWIEAEKKYRQAYDTDPTRLQHLRSLAHILLKLSVVGPQDNFEAQHDKSKSFFTQAISREPDPASSWFQRGVDYLEVQDLGNPSNQIREVLTAEAFAGFRQFLRSNTTRIDLLRTVAALVWKTAEALPTYRLQGLRLLNDVCILLIELAPNEPDYRFARGLTLFTLLSETPNWPDDQNFTSSAFARRSFKQVLHEYRVGLELLSHSGILFQKSLEQSPSERASAQIPRPNPRSASLLSDVPSPGTTLSSSTFQERLATVLNRELERLMSAVDPHTLPAWYKFQMAIFFRRVAATGYTPAEDQMAFFRLAGQLMTAAEASYQEDQIEAQIESQILTSSNRAEYAMLLAEKGFLMAEMTRVALADVDFLLSEAEKYWTGAEAINPGASRYALARWAAWHEDVEITKPLLRHTAKQQDLMLWPTFEEAQYEPAFANFVGQAWFKNAWFGYNR
jgi:tetratricopeptide (TPR) repeat protein